MLHIFIYLFYCFLDFLMMAIFYMFISTYTEKMVNFEKKERKQERKLFMC